LTVNFDYVWFVPSGAVKNDLREGSLTALPIVPPGMGDPIGILTRVDAPPLYRRANADRCYS
jgi:hypothetical protein